MRYTFLILVFVLVFRVDAQQTLSLSDAIQIGLRQNYGILIEEQNVGIAQNNNSWGEAGRWPTISLNVNQNNGITDNVEVANPFQLKGQIISNSLIPSVNLNWILFDGHKTTMNKRRFEQLQAETEGNASVVIANTLQSIILGYYRAVLEKERLDDFQNQLSLSRDKFNYVQIKSDLGGAVSTDVLLEEGNYLTDSINFINQELVLRNAVRDLNVLLAEEDMAKSYNFSDSLNIVSDVYTINDLQAKMLESNVDLKKQYITQSLLRTNVSLSKANRYPTLSLNAGFSENRGRSNLSNTSIGEAQRDSLNQNPNAVFVPNYQNSLNSVTDNYFANFTLSFTLFNGDKVNRAIRNSLVSERIGELRIDQLETSLNRDLVAALDQYNIRRQLYNINDRREQSAQINLELSQDKFRNGSITSFDFRDVQNNYLSSSILKLQAAYNLISSKIELMRLTGGLVKEYNQ